jgi:DMSO/TMAO reductase YedYZ molybdopterin-dependent catalytic subunit
MMTENSPVSAPARVAADDEAISAEELALAARNHGLPLEALRYDVSPPGLHYVLVHYDIPMIDAGSYRLEIDGLVDEPLSLTLADLQQHPASTARVTFECAGNGRARMHPRPISQPWLVEAVGTADWTGVRLRTLLQRAGVNDGAHSVVMTGSDHGIERGVEQDYQRALTLPQVEESDPLLAWAMNGQPLPPQHGFPLRVVVPGWYGMAQVKWLRRISVTDREFDGFQNAVAYRLRTAPEDPGEPVTRIEPRALLIPPGFPDFMSRTRVVRPGAVRLAGRAWSGWGEVTRVEVSADGGGQWQEAACDPSQGPQVWRGFHLDWDARPGRYQLCVRASDATGRVQPDDQVWNRGGFANNTVQRVSVVVLDE